MITEAATLKNEKGQKLYPVSEIFTSPQGEGMYAGQMQTFIRLAGCTVGKPYSPMERRNYALPIYIEKCMLYDGRVFPCDTDYRSKSKYTAEELIQRVPMGVDDVCITGGEPLMHDLSTLITYLFGIGKKVHIETSGTIYVDLKTDVWVTVSPKKGIREDMVTRANEIKLLVNEHFDPTKKIDTLPMHHLVDLGILAYEKPIFLQPVNYEKEVNGENLNRCMEWQRKYPGFRVCIQQHKAISYFIGQEVR